MWAVVVIYGATLVITYVVSPYDIAWHLGTSIDRVLVLVVMVLSATNASWFLVAVAPRAAPDRATMDASTSAELSPAAR